MGERIGWDRGEEGGGGGGTHTRTHAHTHAHTHNLGILLEDNFEMRERSRCQDLVEPTQRV